MPESGLAKNRMKQYLETATSGGAVASSSGNSNQSPNSSQSTGNESEELPKGLAKSLLAKWKSMENVDKETAPESNTAVKMRTRAMSKDRSSSNGSQNNSNSNSDDHLPQAGTAKNLLSKWQNIDSNGGSSSRERKGPRQITPPPANQQQHQSNDDEHEARGVSKTVPEEELAALGRGLAKNALAK
jgi:hypothetical protein